MPSRAVAVRRGSAVQPWPWPRLLAAVFLPGALLAVVVAVAAPVLAAHGLPRVWAVLGGVLLVLAPVQVALTRRFALPGPVLTRGGLRGRRLAWVGGATGVVCLVLPGIGLPMESSLPRWADTGLSSLAGADEGVRWVTVVLWVLAAVVVGPVVEEAWFRGCLQPRTPGGAWAVPVRSAALFAAYHLWQPQTVVTVFLFALPLCLLVQRTRATGVAAAVHVAVNAVTAAGLLAGLVVR